MRSEFFVWYIRFDTSICLENSFNMVFVPATMCIRIQGPHNSMNGHRTPRDLIIDYEVHICMYMYIVHTRICAYV